MAWRIELTASARKQLARIGAKDAKRILRFLRRVESLPQPRQRGKPLRGELAEYWRYRVGNFRLVCEIQDDLLMVLVLRIGHRGQVYR